MTEETTTLKEIKMYMRSLNVALNYLIKLMEGGPSP